MSDNQSDAPSTTPARSTGSQSPEPTPAAAAPRGGCHSVVCRQLADEQRRMIMDLVDTKRQLRTARADVADLREQLDARTEEHSREVRQLMRIIAEQRQQLEQQRPVPAAQSAMQSPAAASASTPSAVSTARPDTGRTQLTLKTARDGAVAVTPRVSGLPLGQPAQPTQPTLKMSFSQRSVS